jgi:hypothetical protein
MSQNVENNVNRTTDDDDDDDDDVGRNLNT